MKYYLIAGEASGDLHASNLMKALSRFDKEAVFRYFGGDLMREQGGTLVKHYKEMAFMGLVDVIANLRTISANLKHCKKDISKFEPDALILIDYAGFNLNIAEYAGEKGFRVFYYIAPKVWAWRKKRVEKLKKFTEKIFVILPFEVDYFRKHNLEAEYYGNPLMDSIHTFRKNKKTIAEFRKENGLGENKIIALLAGSRKHEVQRCLPQMLKSASAFPEYRFVIAGTSSVHESVYTRIIGSSSVKIVYNQTYDLLNAAHAAVVTSGTATLETALFRVPQVVIYKTAILNYIIGRPFIRIKFFSLVNLIAGKEVVKELLQFRLASGITRELDSILRDPDYYREIKQACSEIADLVGNHGSSERVGARMTELLKPI